MGRRGCNRCGPPPRSSRHSLSAGERSAINQVGAGRAVRYPLVSCDRSVRARRVGYGDGTTTARNHHESADEEILEHIELAGYAWFSEDPYATDSLSRRSAQAELRDPVTGRMPGTESFSSKIRNSVSSPTSHPRNLFRAYNAQRTALLGRLRTRLATRYPQGGCDSHRSPQRGARLANTTSSSRGSGSVRRGRREKDRRSVPMVNRVGN